MALKAVLGDALIQENLKQFVLVLSVSLSVATLSRLVKQFRQIPYSLLLVLVGLFLALLNVRLVDLSPDLTLFVTLPPLVLRAAWNLEWSVVRRSWIPVSLYATVEVLVTIAGVAFALHKIAHFPLMIALFVGTSLSATDSAPVATLFRQLGVEKRLTTVTDGENLFNSGIAIAAFILLMELPANLQEVTPSVIAAQILAAIGIGFAVGALSGLGLAYLLQSADLPVLARSLIFVSAYGPYLIADELGGSGILAVVTTGLILRNLVVVRINPYEQQELTVFLDFISFFINSIVFLLIGDQVYFKDLAENLVPIGLAIVTVLLTRAITIFGLGSFSNQLVGVHLNWREQTLLWWTGFRGAASIALALSVPIVFAQRDMIESTVFGVVLFTLLVQGLTTKLLLDKLGFLQGRNQQKQYLQAIARSVALRQTLNYLNQQHVIERWKTEPQLSNYQRLIQERLNDLQAEIDHLEASSPELQLLVREQLRQELIAIETDVYAELVRRGTLGEPPPPSLPTLLPTDDHLLQPEA